VNPRLAWPAVVLVAAAMVAAAVMAVAGVPQETIILVIGLLVSPVLTAMVAVQVADVRTTAKQVQQQTNGQQAHLIEVIQRMGQMLADSAPAPGAGDVAAPSSSPPGTGRASTV
jgi:hypothetical protein